MGSPSEDQTWGEGYHRFVSQSLECCASLHWPRACTLTTATDGPQAATQRNATQRNAAQRSAALRCVACSLHGPHRPGRPTPPLDGLLPLGCRQDSSVSCGALVASHTSRAVRVWRGAREPRQATRLLPGACIARALEGPPPPLAPTRKATVRPTRRLIAHMSATNRLTRRCCLGTELLLRLCTASPPDASYRWCSFDEAVYSPRRLQGQ
eukprot:scaffold596_cov378-Prasinococcus_capsulatus_cf.AAC.4